ncbi:hypothetical protein M434DRAFT_393576, partial [Hypoxylon sp. CO27-5]
MPLELVLPSGTTTPPRIIADAFFREAVVISSIATHVCALVMSVLSTLPSIVIFIIAIRQTYIPGPSLQTKRLSYPDYHLPESPRRKAPSCL